VRNTIPSVVISARSSQRDELNVRVYVDGKLVANHLDGRPLELNPGSHKFRFESEKYPAEERQLLIVPGEKLRAITVTLGASEREAPPLAAAPSESSSVAEPALTAEPAPPPVLKPSRPIPAASYVFGAVALAGLGSFTGFALWALDERETLDSSCRPACTSSQVDSVRTKLIVADASLGLALASAVTATVFYINRPWVDAGPASVQQTGARRRQEPLAWLPRFDVDPVQEAAWLRFRGSF
jgi:hypothetical protein